MNSLSSDGNRRRSGASHQAAQAVAAIILLGASAACSEPPTSSAPVGSPSVGQSAPAESDQAVALNAWYADGGTALTEDLSTALSSISRGVENADIPGVAQACASLEKDVAAARAFKSIPDAQAQGFWSDALAQFALAAASCQDGTTNLDVSAFTRSQTELQNAAKLVMQSDARMRSLGATG